MVNDRMMNAKSMIVGGWKVPLCGLMALAGGCSLEYAPEVCPYNVSITYTSGDGRGWATGDYPIEHIRQFVYDADGVLVEEFRGDTCRTGVGTFRLPPGDYTLVAWGNAQDEVCRMENVRPGESRIEEGRLQAHRHDGEPASRADGDRAEEHRNTGRLYYGTLAFTAPSYGVANYTIGMTHAHARINLTVEWKDEIPAKVRSAQSPVMWMRDVATGYCFAGGETWGDYCYPCHDPERSTGIYRTEAAMDAEYKIKGSFTTLRLTDENHPVVTVTDGTEGLMREIDLSRYFTVMGIGLTRNIRQEFDLTIRIGRNQTLIMQTNMSGWEEGGLIGTN